MSGGGGGGYQPPQDNSIQLEQMRQAAAQKEQERVDAEKAQAKIDYQNKLGAAVEGARSTGQNYFSQRGLDANSYGDLIDSIIGETKQKVPELDANPASYFTSDAFAGGLSNAENLKRMNLSGQVNSKFAPGFEKSLISDTADDSIIDSILGRQRAMAEQQIDFNRKRGVLNDTGYSAVVGELGNQGNAARSTLTGIGDSILGKGRQDLLNLRGDAGNAASGYQFGMPEPDVMSYYNQAQTKANDYVGGLEGSILSALGGTNLFDVPTLLQKGGTAQGPINLTTTDANTALPFDSKKANTKRGLGSTGVF